MYDWILSSSVLIAAVIALRAVTKGRISMRLRYGLWALVLVRLLIPGNFIPSNFSIEKVALFFERQPQVQQISQQLNTPQQSYDAVYQEVVKEHYEVYYPQEATVPDVLPESFTAALPAQEQAQIRQEAQLRVEQSAPIYSLKQILLGIWILGMAVSGTFLLTVNLSFARRLKRTRTPVEADTPVPVYQSVMAETPCLFGLFRPVIYITGEAADNPRALSHILAHESCHYRHKDHIWAILRCVCLVLHWYNPLVWAAFSLSRRDCELACDEAAIARIGESNRHEYGRTLVDMTCVKQSTTAALLTATTMLSDRNTLVQRIRQIAKKPKVLISAVVIAVIIAAVAVGCTFTGAPDEPTQPSETAAPSLPTVPTQPQETTPTPSEDPFANIPWEYTPDAYPSAAIREALGNLEGKNGTLSVEVLSVAYDGELTEAHQDLALILLDTTRTKELGLTKETIPTYFGIYNATVMIKSDGTAPTQYPTGTYCIPFMTIQSAKDGLCYILDTRMPYTVDEPSQYELQLYRYRNLFDSSTPEGRIRQMALTSFYANPSFVDISAMFYGDLSKGELSDGEKAFLTGKGFDLDMAVQSHTTQEIDDALQLAFGIPLSKTQKTGLDALTYCENTDSYYSNHNDTMFPGVNITRYVDNGDGQIDLYYTAANMYVPGHESGEYVVRIHTYYSGGNIYILSNSLVGVNNTAAPMFPDAPSAAGIRPLPANAGVSDLVKPYWEQGIAFAGSDTYYIAIPEIYPFSEEALDINREIYDLFAAALKNQINGMITDYGQQYIRYFDITGADPAVGAGSGNQFYYGYTASYRNNVLSIVVILDDTASGRETYHAFNLNVSAGESGTVDIVVNDDVIRAALEAAYKAMHADLDSTLDFYRENLEKTLSDENVRACTVSYGSDGSLQITGWIYTIGAVEKVQKLITIG